MTKAWLVIHIFYTSGHNLVIMTNVWLISVA